MIGPKVTRVARRLTHPVVQVEVEVQVYVFNEREALRGWVFDPWKQSRSPSVLCCSLLL